MFVKGELQSIDFAGNTCTVRLPLYEANASGEVIVPAVFSNTPGSYNGYKVGDVVFVAFENEELDNPVVMGKLYLGVTDENNSIRGAVSCANLTVTEAASLPITTKLAYGVNENTADAKNGLHKYSTIADIISGLSAQTGGGMPQSTPRTAICMAPDTNLYGYRPPGFSYTTSNHNGKSCYMILYNGSSEISTSICIKYMQYMMGVDDVPKSTHNTRFTEAIWLTNGLICYPEYDGTNLYLIKATSEGFTTPEQVENLIDSSGAIDYTNTTTGTVELLNGVNAVDTYNNTSTSAVTFDLIDTTV